MSDRNLNISAISDTESAPYDALARERGTVFHGEDWTATFGDRLTRYGVFRRDGELVAGFHLYRTSLVRLTVLRDPPFTPPCGPFISIKAKNPVAVLEERRDVLNAIAGFLDNRSHAVVSVSFDSGIQDLLPFVWRKFKVVPAYTYILDLSPSFDELKGRMSPVRRNDISKAVRDGLIVRQTSDLEMIRHLVQETFARRRVQASARYLDGILFRFSNGDNSYAFASYRGDTPIACCFVVHGRSRAYYLLGGHRGDGKHHGAGALALFTAIRHAKEIGLEAFDFEGSMIPAIEKYFRGFGGQLTPYYRANKAWLPIEMVLKFVRREIF
jgi:hypothetical protein